MASAATSETSVPDRTVPDAESEGVTETPAVKRRNYCTEYWVPRQFSRDNHVLYAKRHFRELFIYVIYLVLVCYVVWLTSNTAQVYVRDALSTLFVQWPIRYNSAVTFDTIATVQDVYEYVNNTFIIGAFWNLSENGPRFTDEELGYVFYGNQLVGVPRLRQLRVADGPCVVSVKALDTACFGAYSPQTESRLAYGNVSGNVSGFQYSAADDEEATYAGRLGSYSPGGFVRELRQRSFMSVNRDVDELYRNQWIDHSTRAVFIELTLCNPHLHVLCAIK